MPAAGRGSLALRIGRGVLICLLLAILLFGYTCAIGFPRPVREWLQRGAEEYGLCLDIGSVKLGFGKGLVLREVKIYEIGAIGPAMVEAHEVVVGFDILGFRRGADLLEQITVRNGTLRKNATIRALFSGFRSRSGAEVQMDVGIRLRNCDLYGLRLSFLSCPLVIDEAGVRVEGIRGVLGTGEGSGPFTGHVVSSKKSGTYQGRFDTQFDPRHLIDFLNAMEIGGLEDLIRSCVYRGDPCDLEAAFMRTPDQDGRLIVNGHFRARDFRYRGTRLVAAQTPVVVELSKRKRVVTLGNLEMTRPEGQMRLKLIIDLIKDTLQFEGTSTGDPMAVATMIHSKGPSYLAPYRIEGPVAFSVNGSVCYTNELETDVSAEVTARKLGYSRLMADECTFSLKKIGRSMVVSNFVAAVYDGAVRGAGAVYPDSGSTNMLYSMNVEAEGIDFKRLVTAWSRVLGKQDDLTGRLSGRLRLAGDARKGAYQTLKGRGSVRIREGRIFRLPLFGALSSMLVKIVPGLEYTLRQTDGDAEFTIADGKVRTDELLIAGALLGVKAKGDYSLDSNELNFDVELRFLKAKTFVAKVARIITFPISQLFKVRLSGTVAEPVWESVNL